MSMFCFTEGYVGTLVEQISKEETKEAISGIRNKLRDGRKGVYLGRTKEFFQQPMSHLISFASQ
eukprot:5233690-Amphidinium_carterae.1